MNEPDIALETIKNLQRIFTIVLGLSLGESFKQFVADKTHGPSDEAIRWNRLLALASFLLLIVPFYHGMNRYIFDVYHVKATRPDPYAWHLIVDTIVFTFEAILFFVMCRSLSHLQWRRFYGAAALILAVDILWALVVWKLHGPVIVPWLIVNVCALPLLLAILFFIRSHEAYHGPILAFALIFARTVADYAFTWSFYFPT